MRPYRGRRTFEVVDPILEPLWGGERVLAHVQAAPDVAEAADVVLVDRLDVDVSGELPGLRAAVAGSVMASHVVIDGVISRQVGLDGIGAAVIPEIRGRPGLLLRGRADLDVVPRGDVSVEAEATDGFIAFDLLWVDGASLLDVPLLERKRLLESVVRPGPLVRTSVHVRPPVEPWVATWKSVGLRGGILKAANSRYDPGKDTIEWRIVEHLDRRRT
jgi:hypothetical protein